MNRKQWFYLAFLFFVLFIGLIRSANFYDNFQGKFADLAIKMNGSLSDSSQLASQAFMISDNIYRMGSSFAFVLALGFLICGFLEPKQKH